MYKKQCTFWNNKYLFNFWTVASHILKQNWKKTNLFSCDSRFPRTYILKTSVSFFLNLRMVSSFLVFQSHLSLHDLYNHNKTNGSIETNIIIAWLTEKISIISAHQIAQCGLPDFRKLFKDEQILNIYYFKGLYQIYNDHQKGKYHILPSPSKAYQKACIK